jgi:hypothetical protein
VERGSTAGFVIDSTRLCTLLEQENSVGANFAEKAGS